MAAYLAAHPPPPYEVWSCNWPAFELFAALATQWRVGMNGPTGLIYQEAYLMMDEQGLTDRTQRQQRMSQLRAMEQEVLKALAERRSQK